MKEVLQDLNTVLNPQTRDVDSSQEYGCIGIANLNDLKGFRRSHQCTESENVIRQFKHVVANNGDLSLHDFCVILIRDYEQIFPDFCNLAQIMRTVPLTSVPCERGFFVQNEVFTSSSGSET